MKNPVLIGAFAVVIFSFAIAYALHQTMPAETFVPLPGPYADSVYKYITVENSYKKWSLWPGKGRYFKAMSPLQYATTYVNDNARISIKAGERMIDGSIIVTENYTEKKKLLAVFVMYKVRGYNPPAGDWFWAEYDAKGKTQKAGKVNACIECHSKKKSNDYVFTKDFVK